MQFNLCSSKYFFSIGIWPLGGSTLGNPSVNNITAAFLFLLDVLIVSIPVYNPSHKFVQPPSYRLSTEATAFFLPASSILVSSRITWALSSYLTSDRLSFSVKLLTIVFTACFTTSKIESPAYSCLPDSYLILASLPIEPEVSTTQQISRAFLWPAYGGVIETFTKEFFAVTPSYKSPFYLTSLAIYY